MAERITVTAPDGQNYPIVIASGLLSHVRDWLGDGRCVVITNTTVAPLYGQPLAEDLQSPLITMPDGEQYKNLDTVAQLYADLVATGADRHTTVIALGGGVVGDTAGFVAATYMRGVRLVQIPTTLLAMVDSSVGGKVGVDLPQGKNLVGAFKQPAAVLIDPEVLSTLPDEQWRCGMAEIIKHGLIADQTLLDTGLHCLERAAELVRRAVQVKVDIVEADPYEQNIRAHLNLGHTFGHAIEQVTGYAWLHGEAVGVGLLAAAKLSHRLGLCDAALIEKVEGILRHTGLPVRLDKLGPEALYRAMRTDKKWRDGISRFVVLRDVGDVVIVEGVEEQAVLATLRELQ